MSHYEFTVHIFTENEKLAKECYDEVLDFLDHPDVPKIGASFLWKMNKRVVL